MPGVMCNCSGLLSTVCCSDCHDYMRYKFFVIIRIISVDWLYHLSLYSGLICGTGLLTST